MQQPVKSRGFLNHMLPYIGSTRSVLQAQIKGLQVYSIDFSKMSVDWAASLVKWASIIKASMSIKAISADGEFKH